MSFAKYKARSHLTRHVIKQRGSLTNAELLVSDVVAMDVGNLVAK
jgi:hypothetical protein